MHESPRNVCALASRCRVTDLTARIAVVSGRTKSRLVLIQDAMKYEPNIRTITKPTALASQNRTPIGREARLAMFLFPNCGRLCGSKKRKMRRLRAARFSCAPAASKKKPRRTCELPQLVPQNESALYPKRLVDQKFFGETRCASPWHSVQRVIKFASESSPR